MPKQKTVKINVEAIEQKIEAQGWSNAYFCEKYMQKGRGWISEWKRGSSLPTPKDTATMCVLLHTTPEEILLTESETAEETAKCQEDIALVRGLLEEMQGAKKAPATEDEGLTEIQKAAIQFVLSLPPDKLERFVKMGRAAFGDDDK